MILNEIVWRAIKKGQKCARISYTIFWEREIQRIMGKFEELTELKADYFEKLKNDAEEREIEKKAHSRRVC